MQDDPRQAGSGAFTRSPFVVARRWMTTYTDEISSMIVASAEPKPIRLASPTMFWVTRAAITSRPLRPLLITHTRSNARSDSMT